MKILVLSDSHGNRGAMLDAVRLESPDMILHLGDFDMDCSAMTRNYPEIPLRSVRGNCDLVSRGPDTDEFVIDGKRFFMTHGHLHKVKTGLHSVINAALYHDADVLLFGHTHSPHYTTIEKLSVINPGSIGIGKKTYAILELKNGALSCDIRNMPVTV